MTESYRDLKIYKASYQLAVEIHEMTMKLPKYELYETGSQIRRASKSICLNIVEGYGRRRYKNEFIQFLTYSLASCDETREALRFLYDTGLIEDKNHFEMMMVRCDEIGRMLSAFIRSVEAGHKSKR